MKVLILGAHPDDPESGCGGLAAQCVAAGHEVIFTYATAFRKGRTCFGLPEKEVRTREALAACDILGVRAVVWDFPHEGIHVTPENTATVRAYLDQESPDVIVTHWPVDTHPDHRCVGTLVLNAYLAWGKRADFYYFEVMTGMQSMLFHPTDYVDISTVAQTKHRSLLCHRSQDGESVWQDHELMHRFRGRECGVERAEAYARLERGSHHRILLPELTQLRSCLKSYEG